MTTEKTIDVVETPTFRLEGQGREPEIYAEGFTNLLFGYPNTRVVFHSVVEPPHDGEKEQRRAILTLTIPTVLAIQLAQTILSGTKGNEQLLIQVVDQQVANLKQMIAAQAVATLPPGMTEKDFIAPNKPKAKDS